MSEAITEINSAEEHRVALIIHGFVICHVAAAFVLGPGAAVVLTPLTYVMTGAICDICSVNTDKKSVAKTMARFVGLLLGVGIAQFLIGLFPLIGNLANSAASAVTTYAYLAGEHILY